MPEREIIMINMNNNIEAINTMTTEEATNMNTNEIITKANKNHSRKNKRIICVETGEIFKSVNEASRTYNTASGSICKVCNGKLKTTKGMTFRYIDENNNIIPVPEVPAIKMEITIQKPAKMIAKGKRCNGNTNAVLCISTGQVFTSCTDAAEQTGTHQSNMSAVCRGVTKTAKGKKFCYVKDINEHLEEVAESIRKANMYDELMTKEEKRKELIADVQHWESEIERLDNEMVELARKQTEAANNLNIARHRLMYFN